jgi:hypothetical protein
MQYIKDAFVLAKQSNDAVLIKNIFSNTPSWDDFINNLNQKFNSEKTIDIYDKRFHNNVLVYNKLDPISFTKIRSAEDYSNNIIEKSFSIYEIINNLNIQISYVKSILNFVGNEADYYIHADHHDVISWHCIGQMEWRIYKTLKQQSPPPTTSDEPYESYILNPGDMLFVPGGLVHQVIVTEPRASILFNCYI